MELKIGLLQIKSCGFDLERALEEGIAACRAARRLGADIAVFPEMWSIGYSPISHEGNAEGFDVADPRHQEAIVTWQGRAIPADGEFCEAFAALARELEMAIVLTLLERWPGAPRNTAILFDRRGNRILTYAKVHTCGFSQEAACTPGDQFPTADLDTAAGTVRVGVMICFDREFPESARVLSVQGAELILVPNACELEDSRLAQIRSRAFENAVGIAVANYPPPTGNGSSVACSPIAFDSAGSTVDPWIIRAPDSTGVFVASFDLDAIRRWRKVEPWGNPWRKPHAYLPLVLPSHHPGTGPSCLAAEKRAHHPSLEFRHATLADLPILFALVLLAGDDRKQSEFHRRKVENGETRLILENRVPIGLFILTREFFERPFLSLLYLQESHRNTGIGTSVLRQLLAERTEELFTSTNVSNTRMIHVLTGLGFIGCGIVDCLDPGDPELIFHWQKKAQRSESA